MKITIIPLILISLLCIGAKQKIEPVYNVYYGDLHNHSVLSDGMGKPLQAYNDARYKAKLDFFSLADHAESLNLKKWGLMQVAAQKTNEDGKFVTQEPIEKLGQSRRDTLTSRSRQQGRSRSLSATSRS